MEYSIIGYEVLGYSAESLKRFKCFELICKQYKGEFTLLWHNSYFVHPQGKKFYRELTQ
jgi:hypothetical protein